MPRLSRDAAANTIFPTRNFNRPCTSRRVARSGAILDDPDRRALIEEFGDVFTSKTIVELEPPQISPLTP